MKSLDIVTIIPARGGSKGLPRKNLLEIHNGVPLVVYTAFQSKASKLVDRTIVSTDDSTIRSICENNSIEVLNRPHKISGDTASSESAIKHALSVMEKDDYIPDVVVFLQCTSPLRDKNDIDNAIQLLIDNDYDSVFSVTESHKFLWKVENGKLKPFNQKYYEKRPMRQNRKLEYIENGSIYVFKRSIFLTFDNRICGKKGIYIMPKERSFEIDDCFDLWLCREIIKKEG